MITNLLTIRDLATRLSCTDRHIRNLVKRGVLSKLKLGGSLRFHPDTVERELEALTVTSQTLASARRNKAARL